MRRKSKEEKLVNEEQQQNELEESQSSSKEIQNHLLPEGQDIKESRVIEKVEVKPVTRKL